MADCLQIDLVVSRDAALLPRKLDWMLTERLDDLRNIANDNGTYIQVPSVGSHLSSITVFGDHRTSIERTIRSVMALVSCSCRNPVQSAQRADETGFPDVLRICLAFAVQI